MRRPITMAFSLRSRCIGWFLALALLFTAGAAAAEVRRGGRAAELIAVKSAEGKRLSLKSLRGKPVVLTFGASWCKPCGEELPAWDKLAKAYAGRVTFLAVNIDKEPAKGKRFVAKAKLRHMLVGFEPRGATVEAYDPATMPTTFVIGPSGIVQAVHEGYRAGDEKKLAATLDALLAKSK